MDYRSHWGLSLHPFENTRDPAFFFSSRAHREALDRLLYLAEDGNMQFGLLSGEIGCGKTMTTTHFLQTLPVTRFATVSLEFSGFAYAHLLSELLARLEGKPPDPSETNAYALLVRFREVLRAQVIDSRRHLVVVLDEAQEIPREGLVQLKNLTNLAEATRNYVSIVLVGQPEVRGHVKTLPQLDQRIGLRFHLNALLPDDLGPYLRHRLCVAGHPSGEVFERGCLDVLYRETQGVPREVNRICKLALDRTYSLQRGVVSPEVVASIVRDLNRHAGLAAS